MQKVEQFKKNIMTTATYYEVLDYVAGYVQVFLQTMLAEKVQIPVSVDKILQELEISVESDEIQFSSNHYLANFEFSQGEPYIYINAKLGRNSNLANWLKVKCLARYILNSDIHHVRDRKRNLKSRSEEFLLEFPRNDEILANMIAYEMMLPWKQATEFLLEKDFCNKVSDLWRHKGILSIGESITMDYPNSQKIFAYYHFIKTLEAKFFLHTIDKNNITKSRGNYAK